MAPKLTDLASVTAPVLIAKDAVKTMAYTGAWGSPSQPNTYRLERGFPFNRGGQTVAVVPQFRALSIYASTAQPSGLTSFTSTTTKVTVKYPKAAK